MHNLDEKLLALLREKVKVLDEEKSWVLKVINDLELRQISRFNMEIGQETNQTQFDEFPDNEPEKTEAPPIVAKVWINNQLYTPNPRPAATVQQAILDFLGAKKGDVTLGAIVNKLGHQFSWQELYLALALLVERREVTQSNSDDNSIIFYGIPDNEPETDPGPKPVYPEYEVVPDELKKEKPTPKILDSDNPNPVTAFNNAIHKAIVNEIGEMEETFSLDELRSRIGGKPESSISLKRLGQVVKDLVDSNLLAATGTKKGGSLVYKRLWTPKI